ncbi:hypothetical protein ABZY06_33780 [Streptomyces sp. NPDC006540]|uniref:hypothetical protein n=1 Tax=Streptomyces sp. NPDC006540 TaxID=3155353 RepID=UPI0033A8EFBB
MATTRRTVLFGKAYVWRVEGGRLALYPDWEGWAIFPNATRRAIEQRAHETVWEAFRGELPWETSR